jgi:hypothetical protein
MQEGEGGGGGRDRRLLHICFRCDKKSANLSVIIPLQNLPYDGATFALVNSRRPRILTCVAFRINVVFAYLKCEVALGPIEHGVISASVPCI